MRKRYRRPVQTIRDVARLAGVSPGTVSKALNETDRISPETRERVLAVAAKLNWQANKAARGLVLRRSYLIGLVVSSITNNFCAQLYDGAQSFASERGYSLLLCVTGDDPDQEGLEIKRLTEAVHVDGIIVIPAPARDGRSQIYELDAAKWPYVLVSRRFYDLRSDWVICDDPEGGRLATEHLIQLGHNRIAYVYDSRQGACTNVIERRLGYQKALESGGLPYEQCLSVSVNPQSKPDEQVQLRNMIEARRPTAIFAHNDRTAVAVLQWLKWAGLKVPEDVAVVGFGDFNLATIVTPALTTIQYGIREIGQLAAEALINRLEGKPIEPQQIVVAPRLLVRESCGGNVCRK